MKTSNLITIIALLTFHIQASYGKDLTLTEETLCVKYKNNQEKIIYCIESNSDKPEFTTTIAKYCNALIHNNKITCYDSDEPAKGTTVKHYAQGAQRQVHDKQYSNDYLPEYGQQIILPERQDAVVGITRKSVLERQGAAGATGRKSATLPVAPAIGGNNQFVIIPVPGTGSGGNKRLNGYKTTPWQDVSHYLQEVPYHGVTTWQDVSHYLQEVPYHGVTTGQDVSHYLQEVPYHGVTTGQDVSHYLQEVPYHGVTTGQDVSHYVSPQFNPQDTSIPPASIHDYMEFIKSRH